MRPVTLNSFCFRQFDDGPYTGTKIVGVTKEAFIQAVNLIILTSKAPFVDGYAPFCKHVFVRNFTPTTPGALPITEETAKLIRTGYSARRSEELPVLCRWIDRKDMVNLPPAKYLDLILYSYEQIEKESAAMGDSTPENLAAANLERFEPLEEAQYAIISVKAQDEDYELPMSPITMMRNALISEGGSGVEINREQYRASVAYWEDHIELK